MKHRQVLGWVPLIAVLGCSAKLVADRGDPVHGRHHDAGADGATSSPPDEGAGGASSLPPEPDASSEMGGTGAGGRIIHGSGGSSNVDAGDGSTRVHPGPHCAGLPAICGPTGDSDCCASVLIPGGTFHRDGGLSPVDPVDINDPDPIPDAGSGIVVEATVSDFRLDTYEVTVARFRQFADDSRGHAIPAGSGKNPNTPGTYGDFGWDWDWNDTLLGIFDSSQRAKLDHDLNCNGQGTWSESTENDALPINCVNWYEAWAFCIWDGGRLPTEAEWHYAAEGGDEQRHYPWSNPAERETIDPSYAVYSPGASFVAPVGSLSKGNGKWGNADLAGNVAEWLKDGSEDVHNPGFYPATCTDCVNQYKDGRQTGGGSFLSNARSLRATTRDESFQGSRSPAVGIRCVRAPQ